MTNIFQFCSSDWTIPINLASFVHSLFCQLNPFSDFFFCLSYHTSEFLFSSLFSIISIFLLIFFIWWALVIYFPFIFFFSNYISLAVAVLGLHCRVDFSRCSEQGASLWQWCAGFPLWWLLLSTGSVAVAPRLSGSEGSSWVRNWTQVVCIGRRILYHWATREVFLSFFSHGLLRLLSIFIIANLKSSSSESYFRVTLSHNFFLKTSHLHQYSGNWRPDDPCSRFVAAAAVPLFTDFLDLMTGHRVPYLLGSDETSTLRARVWVGANTASTWQWF